MRPSIGRIVHFVTKQNPPEHLAAIITGVVDDHHVDLTVFLRGGATFFATAAEYDGRCVLGSWHWPERES